MNSFTVVTPNFNMGCYLERTIESVLKNLRRSDEYFVVDGGSTDSSLAVIRSYEHYLTGWVSERDAGYADAIAKGFSRSSGSYQCWINSGDVLLPGALDTARTILDREPHDMIFGDDFYMDEADKVIFVSCGKVRSLRKMMLYGGWTPLQDACFWRRSLYESVGGIEPRLKYAADFDLFLRFSLRGRCQYVPVVFSAFRKHRGQKSIQHARQYERERESCRKRELERLGLGGIGTKFRELYYGAAVRLRARVVEPMRRSSMFRGTEASRVASGRYT